MALTPAGEDTLLLCDCVRLSRQPRGGHHSASHSRPMKAPLPVEKVATPNCKTIAELAAFLGVPESRTAKAVFYVAEGRKAEGQRISEGNKVSKFR